MNDPRKGEARPRPQGHAVPSTSGRNSAEAEFSGNPVSVSRSGSVRVSHTINGQQF